jgi:CheY-like chemotaxis protein
MNSLLGCYFPTKLVFVDDDEAIVRGARSFVNQNLGVYEFFLDPLQALTVVNNSESTDFIASKSNAPEDRIQEIDQMMLNKKRHEEVSVVIVDFHMPSMTGLEFCAKIQSPYVRKILYTGIADEETAIKAFNKGLINGYLKKQGTDKLGVVNDLIWENQQAYFGKLTDVLVGTFFKEIRKTTPDETAFYDADFIDYFHKFIKEQEIFEYYINSPVGGFTCLSRDGEVGILHLYTPKTLEENRFYAYETLGQVIDLEDPRYNDLRQDLDSGMRTFCFPLYGADSFNITEKNWERCCQPLIKIGGKTPYYGAYVTYPGLKSELDLFSFAECQRKK